MSNFVNVNGQRYLVNINGTLAFIKKWLKPAGYRITIDGNLLSSSKSSELAVIDPVVTLEANKAGSFEFTLPPDHPMYDAIELRKSDIEVYVKGLSVFRGFPIDIVTDFYKLKTVTCEGELSVFNDSIIRPIVWPTQTAFSLISAILTAHNGQVDVSKQISVGTVTVTGSISYSAAYMSTMEVLQDLVKEYGGYIRIRRTAGVSYLDWLASSPNTNDQIIKIGKNLIDLSQTMTAEDIVTRCIPLGAKLSTYTVPDIEDRLTIKSVNSNLDYLDSADAQSVYGIVTKVVEFDEIADATDLKAAGQAWLESEQFAGMVIDATAFDLNLTDDQFEAFKLLDTVRVISAPHGLNRTFVISKMTLNLEHPGSNRIQLGKEVVKSLTAKEATTSADVQRVTQTQITSSAVKGIIETANGGTIYTHYNSDGVADELYILDGASIDTATRWWRFNINGWAYTPDAGETYTIAADMTGKLTATDIAAGAVLANAITARNLNLTGGSISINTSSLYYDFITLNHSEGTAMLSPARLYIQNNNNGYVTQYEGSGPFSYQKNDSSKYGFMLIDPAIGRADRSASLLLYDGTGVSRAALDMTGLHLYDQSGNLLTTHGVNGVVCNRYSAGETSVTFTANNTWYYGAQVTVPEGYYVIRARAQVKQDTAYCRFGVAIANASGNITTSELGSNSSAVQGNTFAYNGTAIETTHIGFCSANTVLRAGALSKGAGGGVGGSAGTWIWAMRIG